MVGVRAMGMGGAKKLAVLVVLVIRIEEREAGGVWGL